MMTTKHNKAFAHKKASMYLIIKLILGSGLFIAIVGCTTITTQNPASAHEINLLKKSSQLALQAKPKIRFQAKHLGDIENTAIKEASGLAVSRLREDMFWVLNDGGNQATIYAVGPDGRHIGQIKLKGIVNRDWEDMASFRMDNAAYLLVADIGDNKAAHDVYRLHLLREPTKLNSTSPVSVEHTIEYRYEDGPRDAEAIAVDVQNQRIFILSKRDIPPAIYELPLAETKNKGVITAHRIGVTTSFPQGIFTGLRIGQLSAMPTAMDISADGSKAIVMTYLNILLYQRAVGMTWQETLTGKPQVIATHGLQQAEAIGFSASGNTIFYTSEKRPAPLWKLRQVR